MLLKETIKQKLINNNTIFGIFAILYYIPIAIYNYIFLLIFSIFKIDNKKILIVNFYGKGYGDMGKYICEELIKNNYKIYRAAKEEYKNSLPLSINYTKYNSIKYLYHMATSKVRINNNRFSLGTKKRKNQFYIQTRHAGITFKKCEAALKGKNMCDVLIGKNDSKIANLFISNSTFCTNDFKNNFYYNGEILECGCPRNDILINGNLSISEYVKKYFNLSNTDKICLYAPTFRKDHSIEPYNIEYDKLLQILKDKYKGNRKLLIRLHPDISYLTNKISKLNNNIINATDYHDIQELLIASDFMITDYSSCIFDYAIMKKPAVIYAPDIEDYKKERDFLIEPKDTPFPIATNNQDLKDIIANFNKKEYLIKLESFFKNVGLKETGKSCKTIVNLINKITNNLNNE